MTFYIQDHCEKWSCLLCFTCCRIFPKTWSFNRIFWGWKSNHISIKYKLYIQDNGEKWSFLFLFSLLLHKLFQHNVLGVEFNILKKKFAFYIQDNSEKWSNFVLFSLLLHETFQQKVWTKKWNGSKCDDSAWFKLNRQWLLHITHWKKSTGAWPCRY